MITTNGAFTLPDTDPDTDINGFNSNLSVSVSVQYYSSIHKAAASLVTGRSLQNGKISMGNRCTERPPDPVLYGGRPSGSFVNSTVTALFTKPLAP